MTMKRLGILVLALTMLVLAVTPAFAKGPRAGFGELFYEGEVVRTVVPPARMTKEGLDDLYFLTEDGMNPSQRPVVAVAPGDRDYHGGKWAFHLVQWNVTPSELTSEAEVLAAELAGDVTITRIPANDFKCPVQP
jgi:hypothetical protein